MGCPIINLQPLIDNLALLINDQGSLIANLTPLIVNQAAAITNPVPQIVNQGRQIRTLTTAGSNRRLASASFSPKIDFRQSLAGIFRCKFKARRG